MKNILPLICCALLFTACANNQPTQDLSIVPPAKPVTVTDTIAPVPVNRENLPDLSNVVTQQTATPVIQPAATKVSGLNPAHGAPGHRCDISVGAPLNSPVAVSNTTAPAPIQVSTPANVVNNSTAKLNPAHGQPGHDCKIAVGQPLN